MQQLVRSFEFDCVAASRATRMEMDVFKKALKNKGSAEEHLPTPQLLSHNSNPGARGKTD